ncbi:hypothetical protein HN592_00260 [Candidatus Woesearchaeota archaeon]|jgi:hypothetical protein|nr:hypothetical protein [Candidatus Woesearchaeota archaeon]MBT4368761.1 hypothetical protein [Candidatus Woesearchaeota archaeon]MBT4712050.1 hypothetical protein [Candidatus Woesearchaeota archaeon]MBT6639202.1 hypothetical protein [Candidatus Woesearchaeota archaeon]MBT7134402.1 hypothetical protein [Candidatus Woesearchaeota archaeon]
MEEDLAYVGLENPVGIRKGVLESSKMILQNLQILEDVKEVRHRKMKTEKKLNSELSELKEYIRKLRRILPNIQPSKTTTKPKEILDLEKELAAVEAQLTQ